MVTPGVLQLPSVATAVGGSFGSCYAKGNMLHFQRKTSRVPVIGRSKFMEVENLGGCKGRCLQVKRLMKCTTLCFDTVGAGCDYLDSSQRSRMFHPSAHPCFRLRPVRRVIARSDLVSSGTPEAFSPFPETSFGPKARGICFYVLTATAAIFLFVLMVVAHPFVLLFDRYRRRAHHFVAKIWAAVTITPFLKVEFEGLEHLPPPDTPAVYVSNHQSFLDIYALLTLGRSFKFISKTSIFIYPVIGWAMFFMGVIPLKRMDSRSQLECLKRCMDLIRGGASVFFFPEGTRSKDGKLGAFKKGAFSVAAKTEVPVVPMTIMGTGSIMPSGKERILNPGSIKVVIHPFIRGKDAQALCNQAQKVIADTLGR